MKTKHICIFFINFFTLFCWSQTQKDTVRYPQKYGLRIGADLYRLTKSALNENYKGFELVADYRISKKYYIAGELGNENNTIAEKNINTNTSGSYFRVGFDYNGYENWLNMQNVIHIGLRAGFSTFNHKLYNYTNYQVGVPYGINNVSTNQEFNGNTASWLEVVGGFKAELFSNLYAGISLRLNYQITNKEPEGFANLFIPGFGRTYENNKFGAGFNYTISYMIPLYKKK
jgi:hypothetical protein